MVGSGPELFEVVCRRDPLLKELCEGPASASELAAAGNVSQATVRRGLDDLVEEGLVATDERGSYWLTLTGRVVHDQFQQTTERFLGITRAAPWLAKLPRTAPLAPPALEAATVHERTSARTRFETMIRDATAVSGWLLAKNPREVRPLLSREVAEVDLILRSSLTRQLLTECSDAFVGRLTDAAVAVHECETLPPYGLLVAMQDDHRHVLLTVREEDELCALLETDRDDAVQWAHESITDYRAVAMPLEPP